MLTKDGGCTDVAETDIADVLAGTVVVNATLSERELFRLAASQRLTLDVTGLNLSSLPTSVSCRLISRAASFNAPLLQRAGDIDACNATSFNVPQLHSAEGIYALSVTSFDAPRLQSVGSIFAGRATSFNAPRLQSVGDIYASIATSFHAPQLQSAGTIFAPKAASFHALQRRDREHHPRI
jgi:hypothetical protein